MSEEYQDVPPWLAHAFEDEGVAEVPGAAANPRIIKMDSYTSLKATSDEVAWCSAAVCAWMEESGIESTRSAAAISWMTWGKPLTTPVIGCVCVVNHVGQDAATGSTSGNHVALWLGEDGDYVYLWGGNQHDMVKKSAFPKNSYRILGYRYPND